MPSPTSGKGSGRVEPRKQADIVSSSRECLDVDLTGAVTSLSESIGSSQDHLGYRQNIILRSFQPPTIVGVLRSIGIT
jgi:hypothetical protein